MTISGGLDADSLDRRSDGADERRSLASRAGASSANVSIRRNSAWNGAVVPGDFDRDGSCRVANLDGNQRLGARGRRFQQRRKLDSIVAGGVNLAASLLPGRDDGTFGPRAVIGSEATASFDDLSIKQP